VHVDYLNVTVPETVSATVVDEVKRVLDYCGGVQRTPESYSLGDSGSALVKNRNGYSLVGVSGNGIEALRRYDMYAELLWVFAAKPHRVTRIDIAHDVQEPTQAILRSLWRRARGKTGIRLTRKRVAPKNVNRYVRDCLYGDGVTGTVYLGSRKSEVYAKVYDKRNEILDRHGKDIGRPLTRYEMTATSKVGVSLKDASEPEPLFWHFMSNVLSPPTEGVPEWVAGAQGYHMPDRREIMPAERLKQVVSESPEIERWLSYADDVGPTGREYLLGLLRRRILDKPIDLASDHVGTDADAKD